MATAKHRMNISLSTRLDTALAQLAERDDVPQATKAAELLERALEIEEDEVWNSTAEGRDTKRASYLPHEKAWG